MQALISDNFLDPETGLQKPKNCFHLFGHHSQIEYLANDFERGELPHGLIFAGIEGIGKANLAYRIARYIFALDQHEIKKNNSFNVDANTHSAQLISNSLHPNLVVLERQWDEKSKKFRRFITVDDVRKLKNFMQTTPALGKWRVVIIDRVDDMNVNAANAILKILEETPPHIVIFLISSSPANVLPTIRSRCRLVNFHGLGADDLKKAVHSQISYKQECLKSNVDWKNLTLLTQGSVKDASQFLYGDGATHYKNLMTHFNSLPKLNMKKLHNELDKLVLPKNEQQLFLFMRLMLDLLTRLIRSAIDRKNIPPEECKISDRLIAPSKLASWVNLWETINQDFQSMEEYNLDRKTVLLNSFVAIETFLQQKQRKTIN